MNRLLKLLPVLIPIATKFVKSPQGQRTIAKVKASIQAKRNGGGSAPRR